MKHHSEFRRTKAQSLTEQKRRVNPMHGQNVLATFVSGAKPKVDRSKNLGKYLHKAKKR